MTAARRKRIAAKKINGTKIPARWKPSKSDVVYGINLGFTQAQIDGLAEDMRLWAGANSHRPIARKANWGLAFKGWMRREAQRRGLRINGAEPERVSYMDIAEELRGHRDEQRTRYPDFFEDADPQRGSTRHH